MTKEYDPKYKDLPMNIKPRRVECLYCHYVEMTDRPDPQCPTCHQSMVTVLFPSKSAVLTSLEPQE